MAESYTNHCFRVRVYYEDTDAAGIVYYANYLRFAERARTEWLRVLGVGQAEMMQRDGLGFVVRHCVVDFISPAKLDDELMVETRLQESGKVRMTMRQVVTCMGRQLAVLEVTLACVNRQGKPTRFPAAIVEALEK